MATIIRLKKRQAHKLSECATKVYKASKKLMKYIEEEIMEGEDFDEELDERYGGGSGGGLTMRIFTAMVVVAIIKAMMMMRLTVDDDTSPLGPIC